MIKIKYIIIFSTLIAIVLILASSTNRDTYFFYGHSDWASWEWPYISVLKYIIFTSMESIILYFSIYKFWKGDNILISGVGTIFLMFPASCFWAITMHKPQFYFIHTWWLLNICAISLSLFFVRIISRLFRDKIKGEQLHSS